MEELIEEIVEYNVLALVAIGVPEEKATAFVVDTFVKQQQEWN